jgi:hypothetical protein
VLSFIILTLPSVGRTQVVGPHELSVDGNLLGRAKSDKQLLGHLGWDIAYVGNDGDAAASPRTLREFLSANFPGLPLPSQRVRPPTWVY